MNNKSNSNQKCSDQVENFNKLYDTPEKFNNKENINLNEKDINNSKYNNMRLNNQI